MKMGCSQWKTNGQCSKGDSCSFSDELATGKTIVLSRAKFEGQDWRRGRKTLKKSGNRDENSSDERGKIPCRYRYCNNPSCSNWHPPVCQYYLSETGCKFGNKCFFRRVEADEKPSKKSKEGGAKGSVALLKGSIQLNCVSQDPHPRKSILRKEWKLVSNHTVKISRSTWHQKFLKKKERKGPPRGIFQ